MASPGQVLLHVDTGAEAKLAVPEPTDRPAVSAMFERLDAFARDHELTRGQIAGVGTTLAERFAVWRRPRPSSVR